MIQLEANRPESSMKSEEGVIQLEVNRPESSMKREEVNISEALR